MLQVPEPLPTKTTRPASRAVLRCVLCVWVVRHVLYRGHTRDAACATAAEEV